ncbi:uncharacterized protein LOC129286162 [Prosopis cineraria]|uniref:uncharacterized protein LOC129286162 n=1 Tax=Prosopis cineraria TaxID=364024 RepID=UPI0024101FDC|nr:uncharacterized protein LOC129286162 [Prosopis cineraria]
MERSARDAFVSKMENAKRRFSPERVAPPASAMKRMEMDGDNHFFLKKSSQTFSVDFQTRSFIVDHLQHSSHNKPSLILQRVLTDGTLTLYLLDRDMQLSDVQNGPLIDSFKSSRIIGSSNGLLCVQIDHRGIFPPTVLLWNPAIREVRRAPRSRTINDFIGSLFIKHRFVEGIEITNLENISFLSDGVTANGAISWFTVKRGEAFDRGDEIFLVVSFDIAMEDFTLIPPPPLTISTVAKLTVYENKLALLYYSSDGNPGDTLIDLWVMEEGIIGTSEERWSWIKKFSSGPYPYCLGPGTIWRDKIVSVSDVSESLMREARHEEEDHEQKAGVYLLDLTSNEFKVFASSRYGNNHEVFNYVESLVPASNIYIEEPRF